MRRDAGATTSKYAADGVGNADSLKRSKYYKNKKNCVEEKVEKEE